MKNPPETARAAAFPKEPAPAAPQAFAPALALRPKTQAFLERTLYWTPPVAMWEPLRKTKNSSLRIASVTGEGLAAALRFEGDLLVLTPENWRRVLTYAKPQILLVESFVSSSTGHWHMAQHPASPEHDELLALVKLARELSIPAVFWITKGHEHHEHYRHYARHFDLVCCADPLEVKRLAAEGVKAQVLLPCVQPALYNPFRRYGEAAGFSLPVLFDGWADIDRLGEDVSVLRALKRFGLNIVESRYEMFQNRLAVLPEYAGHILGCVSRAGRQAALKYAGAYATLDATISTRVTQQWMSLEAAASRVPVVHQGSLDADDLRGAFAVDCGAATDFVVEFLRYSEDDLYRERVAHRGWRAVQKSHTFAHRLSVICRKLGISHDWEPYPRVSLVTPTYRREMLRRCVDTYEKIAYPNKELVIVYNGDEVPTWADLGLSGPRPDIVIANVPGDLFAGATLNMGHLHASGRYCFRVDDDDHYAPNYVMDMVLHARSVDADLFGKPAAPLIFEGEQAVYLKPDVAPLSILTVADLQGGKTWLGGNSVSGTRAFLGEHPYSGTAYGAADTELVMSLPPDAQPVIALMDRFNMAAERRRDLSSHTWKRSAEQVKARREVIANFDELVI